MSEFEQWLAIVRQVAEGKLAEADAMMVEWAKLQKPTLYSYLRAISDDLARLVKDVRGTEELLADARRVFRDEA